MINLDEAFCDGIENGIKQAVYLLPPANSLSVSIFAFAHMLTEINAISPKLARVYGDIFRRFIEDFNSIDNDLGLDEGLAAAIGDFNLTEETNADNRGTDRKTRGR